MKLIVIILIILVLLIILFLYQLNSNNSNNSNNLKNLSEESNCLKEEEINDIKPCQKGISLRGKCNNIIKKFFKDENIEYSDKYLDNADYTYPAFILSQYNKELKKSELVLPYKIYQKILNSKLKNKNSSICVFIGQSGLLGDQTKLPFGDDIRLTTLLQLYHSALFFVEMTDDKIPDPQKNLQDILFSIELWGEGGRHTIMSNLFPSYKKENNKYIVDNDAQSINRIIIQYPEAFGCKNDGSYWKFFDTVYYAGNVSNLSMESLYFFSNFFISRYWGYSGLTLSSMPCDNINQLPNSFMPSITCDTFAQYMCVVLEIVDSNFRKYNNYKNISWNDIEIIGKYSEVDLNNPNELNDLQIYIDEINEFIKENTKQKFTVSQGENNILSKIIINKIGSEFFQLMIRYITKNVDIRKDPCMYISLFHNGMFKIYKIILEYPYIQSIYGVCPGKMFKKSNYIFF